MKDFQLEEVCETTPCQSCGIQTKIWFVSRDGIKVGFCAKCEGMFRQVVLETNEDN